LLVLVADGVAGQELRHLGAEQGESGDQERVRYPADGGGPEGLDLAGGAVELALAGGRVDVRFELSREKLLEVAEIGIGHSEDEGLGQDQVKRQLRLPVQENRATVRQGSAVGSNVREEEAVVYLRRDGVEVLPLLPTIAMGK